MQIMQDYPQDNKGSESYPIPRNPFFQNSLDNFDDKVCHHW